MKNQGLESFHGCLKVLQLEGLVRSMRHKDGSRTIQVLCVIALKVRDVRAVVDCDLVEAYAEDVLVLLAVTASEVDTSEPVAIGQGAGAIPSTSQSQSMAP